MNRHTQAPLEPELIAAIVKEAATGEAHRAIADRLGVSKTAVWRYANLAGVVQPRSGNARRAALCRNCGAKCWSRRQLCRRCWQQPPAKQPDADAALTGGEWVPNGRGVLVWQPDEQVSA